MAMHLHGSDWYRTGESDMTQHQRILCILMAVLLALGGLTGVVAAAEEEHQRAASPDDANALSETQRNSISMLNYLAVLSQEINASKNSRLYLEDAYSYLVNNTYPNAVDSRTLSHLTGLLDTLESYRMSGVKRERLSYIYEQQRADALRQAVPNPISVLSVVQAKKLATSALALASMAFDAASSYYSAVAEADMQYLRDGWALDNEEAAMLHSSRKDTFSYMIRIVNDYNLPGDLALSETAVNEFVSWKNNTNIAQRLRFLETNREQYQAFGPYWLVLAGTYYDSGDHARCLEAIAEYERISARIFRQDHELAKVLPQVIVAASNVMEEGDYVQFAARMAERLLSNIDLRDWALRFFAAQTYIELYERTQDKSYLNMAFESTLNNVNYLVNQQRAMNQAYLNKVVDAPIPKGTSSARKKEIQDYNKLLKEERKAALTPIYSPLQLNCDLLFGLAGELELSEEDKGKIDDILHDHGEALFLFAPLDAQYRFGDVAVPDADSMEVAFDGAMLRLPVSQVTHGTGIRVTVTDSGSSSVFEDWKLDHVERGTEGDLNSFVAVYHSPIAKQHTYAATAVVQVDVAPIPDVDQPPLSFRFQAEAAKHLFVFDKVIFTRVLP